MKIKISEQKALVYFLLAWLIINLLQSLFTEIMEDEAYYWVFSQHLDWGYFDHPPMIALLIKLGYALVPNTLGARLLPAIMGTATIYLVYTLLPSDNRKLPLFMLVVSGMSLMHLNVAGFLATPDIPLVFFSTLMLVVMRRYLSENKAWQVIALGGIIAAMLYSKYHALLLIGFTLLAHLRLLSRPSFWLIPGIALILYLPHILWQVNNDFVSFQYHLVSRNDPFQPLQILDYIGNQLVVMGPLISIPLLILAFTLRSKDAFQRILKFNLIGFLVFFLLSSVRGHVEPHWTAAAFPPLLILAFSNLGNREKWKKWLRILGLASIPVILLLRTFLVAEIIPLPVHVQRMFHHKDRWAEQIEEVAGDKPVVFLNKYQYPSVYWFYTGNTAFTRNTFHYRRNQYDVWDLEKQLEGQPVILTRWATRDSMKVIKTVYGEEPYHQIEKYCSFNRMSILIENGDFTTNPGDTVMLSLLISNPTSEAVDLNCDCDLPPILQYVYYDEDGEWYRGDLPEQPRWEVFGPKAEKRYQVPYYAPDITGEYLLHVAFGSRILYPGINGKTVDFTVVSPPTQDEPARSTSN